MRIQRLDLTRFGAFTERTLDLSAPGMHLIVGRNEAGKTTAMAAIRQLLYGIPVRSTHAFLHEMRDLTIGAVLAGQDGATLEVVRVKKRNDTLQDTDGNTLDEGLLGKRLHGVAEEVYASLFTIGHDEIAAGGEALLSGDGEVGRALFSASRGTTNLAAVMRALDTRAAELFKSSGSKPLLNAAIREFKNATAKAKELSMSASEVVGLDDKLAAAQKELDRIATERKKLARRKTLLEQVRSNRPQLASRHDALIERDALANSGPLVAPQLQDQLDDARSGRAAGTTAQQTARKGIDRLDAKLAGLLLDEALLGQREAIDQLQTDTGGYEQNRKDLPGLESRAATLERTLHDIRKRLPDAAPLDEQGHIRLTVDQEKRIGQLADRRSKLDSDLEHAVDAVEDAEATLASHRAARETLDEPADVTALVEIIARIRKAGDLETIRTRSARQLATLDATLTAELAALDLSDTDLRSIDALAVPTLETIRGLHKAFDGLTGNIDRLEQRIAGLETQHADAVESLADLLQREHPPTLDELQAFRTHRNAGWQLIRDAWQEGAKNAEEAAAWSAGKPLPDAYERAVEGSDDLADRLRLNASVVEQRVTLEKQIAELADDLQARATELSAKESERDAAEEAWTALWAPHGITAGSLSAMEAWHDRFRECAGFSVDARKLEGEVADHDEIIARHRADLASALTHCSGEAPAGDLSLLALLDLVEQVASAAKTAEQEHVAATTACTQTEASLRKHAGVRDRAQQAITDWRAAWTPAVMVIGLADTAAPAEAKAVLDALSDISTKNAEFEELERRILGIKQRDTIFTDGLTAVLTALDGHSDVADADPGAAVKMLSRRLKEALAVESKSKATTEERENNETALRNAELTVTRVETVIAELVEAARVADEAALFDAIERSAKHANLEGGIEELEDALRSATGKAIDQIVSEADEFEGVEIDPEIQELDQKIEVIDEQLKIKATTVGELTNQRSLIDASGDAADQMTRAQQSLASVVEQADEYVQTVLARRLLEEQVSAYRDQHQGPLLARARELFRTLTLDIYLGLDTDTNDKGEPILLARKADETLLEIAALSTGTRDQLYLALRLAALEQFMDRRGPLPLVLDDLFVHFDDERTAAGLSVLDQLASTTQILLFTHHRQVAKQAADVIDAGRLTVHELA